MQVVILAGGSGSRIWPYAEIRNKAMLPIANQPVIKQTVDALKLSAKVQEIHIIGSEMMGEIAHLFFEEPLVSVHEIKATNGSAATLAQLKQLIIDDFIILFGDCLVQPTDILRLIDVSSDTLLLNPCLDSPHNHIIAKIDGEKLVGFVGHPRSNDACHVLFGAHVKLGFLKYVLHNKGRFSETRVGVSSPLESFLEESLNDYHQNQPLKVLQAEYQCFDINKPWQILEANAYQNEILCNSLTENKLAKHSFIDPSATLEGFVQLGQNSKIGKNVIIHGNCVIGDNTIIDNGVIIADNVVIGNNCLLKNYAKVGSHSTIGDDCILEFTAELLGGVLFHRTYLYHHCEFYGLCGEKVDIGAGTVCGTLRFDDGETIAHIKGRKEVPTNFSNATYLGDYVRTGVSVIFQPGAAVGVNSVVGSGVLLNQKVANNTLIYYQQTLIEKEWGPEKYGW